MPGHDIFLSYANADRERVLPLVRALEGTGWTVFWDRAIPAGHTWRQAIGEEIRGCRSVVVVWSRRSVERDWVQEEAEEGKRRRILVPIILDQVEPPFGFGAIQAADLIGWDGSSSALPFRRLVADLGALLGKPPCEREREESLKAAREGVEEAREVEEEEAGEASRKEQEGPEPRQAPSDAHRSYGRLVWTLSVSGLAAGFALLGFVATGGRAEPLPTPAPAPSPTPTPRAVGEEFRDCAECPEMVVIPQGRFEMGSPGSEKGREHDEGPMHLVTISRPFAVGKYEVTFDEWDACVAASGCNAKLEDGGWGRGSQPVIHVTWRDARKYVSWLNDKTGGQRYRLLSEAEWEYAARAGSRAPYPWGNDPGQDRANFKGSGSVWEKQTAPVGGFKPNGFGLHDMIGNVLERVQDCWNGSYEGAPVDGSAWESGDCLHRGLRGGAFFYFKPGRARAADRGREPAGRSDGVGLRVAQTL